MFDEFDTWQYRDDANCWDFVREYLLHYTNIPEDHIPGYEIDPDDKRAMTKAACQVAANFIECEPRPLAIACHYVGNIIVHVGVIDPDGYVRHTGRKIGTRRDTVEQFEKMHKTVYKIHEWLR